MKVGILYSRIRKDEKLLLSELRERGHDVEKLDVRKLRFGHTLKRCTDNSPVQSPWLAVHRVKPLPVGDADQARRREQQPQRCQDSQPGPQVAPPDSGDEHLGADRQQAE